MRCSDCKHWQRGTVMVFAEDATQFDGQPHYKRGKTEITRPRWHCHEHDQDVGECLVAREARLVRATCWSEGIYGELITDASFGCVAFSLADPDWDHYEHLRYPEDFRPKEK